MNKISFDFIPALCSVCGACSVACMDQNDVDTEAGERPFRRVYEKNGEETVRDCECVVCHHCENAPCVQACPVGCLYRDGESGLVLCDNSACVGCRACLAACPYGVPGYNAEGKMQKCDGCIQRLRAGLLPACVKACPTGAIVFHGL